MKIAHLITGLGVGGAERQLKVLVGSQEKNDLEKNALTHVVISLKDKGAIGQHLINQSGITVYELNLPNLKGLWKLYKILRHEKPDVLQTWLYHADLIGLLIGKLARVPRIVWNIRCSNMDLSRYSRLTSLVVKMLRALSRVPDAVVANSQAGQAFHAHFGYKAKRWEYIPNGIDTDIFSPNPNVGQELRQSLSIPVGALVVGMIGRIDPMKDYATFLKAMEKLSPTYENLYCLVAGKGTENEIWAVTPPRLVRLGIWENVPAFLNALDVMVLSSAFGEGFPNVVGEAMACGIPTIVTDVGDAAHLVQTSAQIIPPQDVDKLTLALKRVLALSSQERKAIGQEGRQRILTAYSLSAMRQRYASFYKSLFD